MWMTKTKKSQPRPQPHIPFSKEKALETRLENEQDVNDNDTNFRQ